MHRVTNFVLPVELGKRMKIQDVIVAGINSELPQEEKEQIK